MEAHVVIVTLIVERCLKVAREDISGKIGDIIWRKWTVLDSAIKKSFIMTHAWFIGLHCNGHDQMRQVNFTHLSPDEQGAVGNSFKNCARNEIFEALARWRIGKRHTWWFATAKVAALKGTVKRNEKLLKTLTPSDRKL